MKYCANCGTSKQSWADNPSYRPEETYNRSERCWGCDKWTLTNNELVRRVGDTSGNLTRQDVSAASALVQRSEQTGAEFEYRVEQGRTSFYYRPQR